MSIDISLTRVQECGVFDTNITHNLSEMAKEAGCYMQVWRPSKIGVKVAGELIWPLRHAIHFMKAEPARFLSLDAPNGWGTYAQFVPWLEKYLAACEQYPDATVSASR